MNKRIFSVLQEGLLWLRLFCDKHRSGNQLIESSWGRFQVKYRDGTETLPMGYSSACAYAEIFGGSVHHLPSGRTCFTPAPKLPVRTG